MSSLKKQNISQNGSNWYLQFHIKPWMKNLELFDPPEGKKNFKKSLRTNDVSVALRRRDTLLSQLGLTRSAQGVLEPLPQPNRPKTPEDAYWQMLNGAAALSDKDVEVTEGIISDLHDEGITTHFNLSNKTETYEIDQEHIKLRQAELEALVRIRQDRQDPFHNEPHVYKMTFLEASKKRIKEFEEEGRDKKTLGKVKISTSRFLIFISKKDIELRLITKKLVSQYIKASKKLNRSQSSFQAEMHHLKGIFEYSLQEGFVDNIENPFRGHSIKGFRAKASRSSMPIEVTKAIIKGNYARSEIVLVTIISYYTGMRISEVFGSKIIELSSVKCFSVASLGGKTIAAKRLIPIHPALLLWLKENSLLPVDGQGFSWPVSTSDALDKRFTRVKNKVLHDLGLDDKKSEYVHHSFRHGFVTQLLEANFHEIEVADLTGHSKSNLGKTEAGKSYFGTQKMSKLVKMIDALEVIDLA